MNVLAERTSMPLRARLVECDCGVPGCSTVFVVLQVVGSHDLWLTIGLSFGGEEAAAGSVNSFLAAPDVVLDGVTFAQLIERGMALVGLEWSDYTSLSFSHEVLEAQLRAWSALPPWMEQQPAGELWALRACVWGRPLTRVPRALWAKGRSYVPCQPEAYEDFDQDLSWGLEVLGRGRAVVRHLLDVPVPAEVLLDMGRWDS